MHAVHTLIHFIIYFTYVAHCLFLVTISPLFHAAIFWDNLHCSQDYPALVSDLDLVEMDDQYTHEIDLASELDTEESLSTHTMF